MSLEFKIINPLEYDDWDRVFLLSQDCSFFLSSSWANVLYSSYKYKPVYFTIFDGNKLSALIPIMEVKSFFTGRRGVSLPFSDYCEPIVNERVNREDIINYIIEYGKKAGWKYLELRDSSCLPGDVQPSTYFYVHTLSLSTNADLLFSKFRDSTKRNIKKAVREGVKVKKYSSLESIKEYFGLHCITRKRQGIPPQPFIFSRTYMIRLSQKIWVSWCLHLITRKK